MKSKYYCLPSINTIHTLKSEKIISGVIFFFAFPRVGIPVIGHFTIKIRKGIDVPEKTNL